MRCGVGGEVNDEERAAIDVMSEQGPYPQALDTIASLLESYNSPGFAEVCRRWASGLRDGTFQVTKTEGNNDASTNRTAACQTKETDDSSEDRMSQ